MKKILIMILFLSAVTTQAQLVENASIDRVQNSPSHVLKPAATPFSLLDFSRIKWSHSYSVNYFSGGTSSNSLGIWNTSMFYEISSKLSLALNVGVAHDPTAMWGDANNKTDILPSFMLDYHPSENFKVSISMQSYKGNNLYGTPYYSPGSRLHDSFLRR